MSNAWMFSEGEDGDKALREDLHQYFFDKVIDVAKTSELVSAFGMESHYCTCCSAFSSSVNIARIE